MKKEQKQPVMIKETLAIVGQEILHSKRGSSTLVHVENVMTGQRGSIPLIGTKHVTGGAIIEVEIRYK